MFLLHAPINARTVCGLARVSPALGCDYAAGGAFSLVRVHAQHGSIFLI
jgi:hypothetical protein